MRSAPPRAMVTGGFVRSVSLRRDAVTSFRRYPFSIPAIRKLRTLELHPKVTFLIGENGSGKSTLLEAIAVAAGFNAEGGTKNFRFAARSSESELCRALRVSRGVRRERDGYFFRAESLFEDTEHFQVYHGFLGDRAAYLRRLFASDGGG
jgi:predicted ATPase